MSLCLIIQGADQKWSCRVSQRYQWVADFVIFSNDMVIAFASYQCGQDSDHKVGESDFHWQLSTFDNPGSHDKVV